MAWWGTDIRDQRTGTEHATAQTVTGRQAAGDHQPERYKDSGRDMGRGRNKWKGARPDTVTVAQTERDRDRQRGDTNTHRCRGRANTGRDKD